MESKKSSFSGGGSKVCFVEAGPSLSLREFSDKNIFPSVLKVIEGQASLSQSFSFGSDLGHIRVGPVTIPVGVDRLFVALRKKSVEVAHCKDLSNNRYYTVPIGSIDAIELIPEQGFEWQGEDVEVSLRQIVQAKSLPKILCVTKPLQLLVNDGTGNINVPAGSFLFPQKVKKGMLESRLVAKRVDGSTVHITKTECRGRVFSVRLGITNTDTQVTPALAAKCMKLPFACTVKFLDDETSQPFHVNVEEIRTREVLPAIMKMTEGSIADDISCNQEEYEIPVDLNIKVTRMVPRDELDGRLHYSPSPSLLKANASTFTTKPSSISHDHSKVTHMVPNNEIDSQLNSNPPPSLMKANVSTITTKPSSTSHSKGMHMVCQLHSIQSAFCDMSKHAAMTLATEPSSVVVEKGAGRMPSLDTQFTTAKSPSSEAQDEDDEDHYYCSIDFSSKYDSVGEGNLYDLADNQSGLYVYFDSNSKHSGEFYESEAPQVRGFCTEVSLKDKQTQDDSYTLFECKDTQRPKIEIATASFSGKIHLESREVGRSESDVPLPPPLSQICEQLSSTVSNPQPPHTDVCNSTADTPQTPSATPPALPGVTPKFPSFQGRKEIQKQPLPHNPLDAGETSAKTTTDFYEDIHISADDMIGKSPPTSVTIFPIKDVVDAVSKHTNDSAPQQQIPDNAVQTKTMSCDESEMASVNISILRSLDEVKTLELLDAMNLGVYKDAFAKEFIDGEVLSEIDNGMLRELGVQNSLHRMRLMRIVRGKESVNSFLNKP
jgi:hypothetical protein